MSAGEPASARGQPWPARTGRPTGSAGTTSKHASRGYDTPVRGPSRREFLQIGITAAAWPIVARAAEARPSTPLLGVVYDTRFAESVAFARRSAALGLQAHAIEGDMTRLWFDEIYHRWQQRPTALAGLTAHGPMFCFAELARDVMMRVVHRAEHRPAAGAALASADTLYRWVIAPRHEAESKELAAWLFPPA